MRHGLRKAYRQETLRLLEQNGTNTSDPPTIQSPTAIFTFYVTMRQKKRNMIFILKQIQF